MLCKIIQYFCPNHQKIRFRYCFKFMHNNSQVRLRKQGFITEAEATEHLEKAYYGIKHGFVPVPVKGTTRGRKPKEKPSRTLVEVLEIVKEQWPKAVKESTVRTYLYKLNRYVVPYLGSREFSKISDADLQKLYENLKGVSMNAVTAPLQSMIRVAKETGLQVPNISSTSWKKTKVNSREEYLEVEEVGILLENCKPEYKHLFALLIHTGMRVGEARGLDFSDVSLKNMTIRIERQFNYRTGKISTPKSGKTRIIPINENVLKILRSYAQTKGSAWIMSGTVFDLDYFHIQKEIVRCRQYVGKEIVVHSLRHTAASLMIQSGIPLEKIGKILGQSSSSITAQYAHLSIDSLREAVDCLPKINF